MSRHRLPSLLCLSLLLALVSACRSYPDYSGDFRFPVQQGNATRGEEAFVALNCHQCHLVQGVELPAWSGERPFTVPLGGELIFAKTYADLVTSIINPDHRLSERFTDQLPRSARANMSTPMPWYSDMTISELVDIVTFLNARYSLLPGYTEYFY